MRIVVLSHKLMLQMLEERADDLPLCGREHREAAGPVVIVRLRGRQMENQVLGGVGTRVPAAPWVPSDVVCAGSLAGELQSDRF